MNPTLDAADAGRFLAWAARPRDVPAKNEEYARLVARYRSDPDFAAVVDGFFSGAGLYLVVDDRDGAVVVAEPDSPLRVTVTDVMKRAGQHHRSVIGATVLGVARTAYPDPVLLDDPDRAAVFTTFAVVDTLDRFAGVLADAVDRDGPVEEADVEMWRRWSSVADARANAVRQSANEKPGIVSKVCRLLVDAGYLTARGDVDGGTWMARPRFRHAVIALCEDSDLYAQLNGLSEDTSTGRAPDTEPGDDETRDDEMRDDTAVAVTTDGEAQQ